MKSKIDIKSAIAGMVLGGILVVSVAAATSQNSSAERFQLLLGESVLFKIDTTTGQVWKTWVSNPDSKFMRANIPTETPLEETAPAKR